MREILFRGKRKSNREWIEGSAINTQYDVKGNKHIYIGVFKTSEGYPLMKFIEWFEVIPETVGQYTGLTDKNGKKIFEGDYIVCRQAIEGNFIDEHIEMGYVEMKHGAFGLHRKQGYYRPFKDWLEDYEYEVLGNIHDNPELLKGDKSDA